MARSATGRDAPDPSLRGPIRNIVASAHKWGGNGVIPEFNKIKRVLLSKHPEVIAKAFGGDANKAAAWIKDNWMAMHGHNPTKWRGKGKSTAQQLATSLNEDPDSEYFAVELSDDDLTMDDLYQEVSEEMLDLEQGTVELFLAADEVGEERDGHLWYPICRSGEWARSPIPNGKPLRLTREHFEQAIEAFNDGAWEHVTIPLTHDDRTEENTGYIRALEIRDDPTRPGEVRLWAAHEFTEPEIVEKVKRKSIIGRSVQMALGGFRRASDNKFYPVVLKHVCLTNKPWINGLNDGLLGAAQGDEPAEVYEPVGDVVMTDDDVTLGVRIGDVLRRGVNVLLGRDDDGEITIVEVDAGGGDDGLDDDLSLGWLEKRGVKRSDLNNGDFLIPETKTLPYKVHGKVDPDGWKAAWSVVNGGHGYSPPKGHSVDELKRKLLRSKPKGVEVNAELEERVIIRRGGGDMGEKKNDDGTIELSKEEFDQTVQEAVNAALESEREAARQRDEQQQTRLAAIERENREMRIRELIAAYQEKGVPPAVLTRAEGILLADRTESGDLKLSIGEGDDKKDVELDFDGAVQALLDAVPTAPLAPVVDLGHGQKPKDGVTKSDEDVKKEAGEALDKIKGATASA